MSEHPNQCEAEGCSEPVSPRGTRFCGRPHANRWRRKHRPDGFFSLDQTQAARQGKFSLTRAAREWQSDRTVVLKAIERRERGEPRGVAATKRGRLYFIDPSEIERVRRELQCLKPGCEKVALGESGYCGNHAGAAAAHADPAMREARGQKISAAKKGRHTRDDLGLTLPQAAELAGTHRETFRARVREGGIQATEISEGAGTGFRFELVQLNADLARSCRRQGCSRLPKPSGYCPVHERYVVARQRIGAAGLLNAEAAGAVADRSAAATYWATRHGLLPTVEGWPQKVYRPADVDAYRPLAGIGRPRPLSGATVPCRRCGGHERYLAPSQLERGREVCVECRLEEMRDPRHWVPLVELALLRRAGLGVSEREERLLLRERVEARLRQHGAIARGQPEKRRLSARELEWLKEYDELTANRESFVAAGLHHEPELASEWAEIRSQRARFRTIARSHDVDENTVRMSVRRALARQPETGTSIQ